MQPSLLLALAASCSEFLGHRGLQDFFVCRVPVGADWCHGTSVEVFNAKNDSCRLQQWIPWYWDDNLKEDDNAGIDGGVGWICFKWPAFHNLRQGGCNIQSEGKANQRWDVDASKVVSFESSIQRCVFNKMSLDVKDFTIGHFESLKWVCIKNLSWPVVWYAVHLCWPIPYCRIIVAQKWGSLSIVICSSFMDRIFHVQGEMRTELLMFREMPSMPLDFPGPKHGSTCFHQNPVVFARPGLAMGLKKNENDGPVCRLSQMNHEGEKEEWWKKIRTSRYGKSHLIYRDSYIPGG